MKKSSCIIGVLAAAAVVATVQAQSRSPNFRLEGSGFVTVAAPSGSPSFEVQITGGNGSPVGESISPSYSTDSGPGQTQLPTEGIFETSFE